MWNIACLLSVEHEESIKSRSSALNPGTALTKILMPIGKFQAFRIIGIMLILGKLNFSYRFPPIKRSTSFSRAKISLELIATPILFGI